jgi:uncharacterized protein YjbI with pentapeptide repeats
MVAELKGEMDRTRFSQTKSGSRLRRLLSVALLSLILLIGWGSAISNAAFADNYTKESLVNVDFSGQDLKGSSFTKANLLSSNLSKADLRGVSLFGANLEGANLEAADLRFATLDSARFVGANLTNAVLEGAFAFNAQFTGAKIDGADFTDVDLRNDVQESLCKIAKGTNPITGRDTHKTLKCF